MCSPFTESVELGFGEATDMAFILRCGFFSGTTMCFGISDKDGVLICDSMLELTFGLIPDELVGVART